MIHDMRRLYPRGAANRGVCVDADGAMFGPEWVLVRRTPRGFAALARDDAASLQKCVLGSERDPDWLFRQSQRIAAALDRGEVALAQIYGLYIAASEIEGKRLQRVADVEHLLKAGFNPGEPRIPAGQPGGGEWTTSGEAATALPSTPPDRDEAPSQSSSPVVGRWPAPPSNPWLYPVQAEDDESGRGGLLGDFMDLPREFRREVYESLEARLREIDPSNPALTSLTGPDYSPTQAHIDDLSAALREAQARAGEPPATAWELGWGARGVALERQRLAGERTLPSNTPTIDDFPYGVALSIKSIDLNAPWYSNSLNLSRQIDRYIDQLGAFDALKWGDVRIEEGDVNGKVLDIVVPMNSGTSAQRQAIAAAIERASKLGVHIFVSPY
jgi:hypothetical protein